MSEKITFRKKMTMRDYVKMLYYLEGKGEPNFDGKDKKELAMVKDISLRVTREIRDKIEEFFDTIPAGVSADTILDSIANEKKPFTPPTQQVVVQAPTPVPIPAPVPVSDEPKPVAKAPTISEDERWEWAKADRTPNYELDCLAQSDVKDFPFIINHNAPIEPKNVDFKMLFYMLEHCKISANEVFSVFNSNNANKMIELVPADIPLDARYHKDVNMYCAVLTGEDIGKSYSKMMSEPEPTMDEILGRYKNYMAFYTRNIIPEHENFDTCRDDMALFLGAEGNKLKFSAIVDDEFDEEFDTMQLEYDNYEQLMTDLLRFSLYDKFKDKINPDQKFNVFDKTISINKFVTDTYKKYPRGMVEGKVFYRTRREAYEEGALKF